MDLSALSDRAWERGRLSLAARLRRLRDKAWMIGQCAVAAGVALVAATIVPGAPLRRPREQAARVTREMARILREARASAEEVDTESAEDALNRARETEALLNELRDAAREGLEVVRSSPFRRGRKDDVRLIADVVGPLDRAQRNTRVLIRRIVVNARLGETMPEDYLALLDRLAHAEDAIGDLLAANEPPYSAQEELIQIAEATSDASEPLTLSAAVVLGQMRSLVVDLLELVGLDPAAAASVVPPRG